MPLFSFSPSSSPLPVLAPPVYRRNNSITGGRGPVVLMSHFHLRTVFQERGYQGSWTVWRPRKCRRLSPLGVIASRNPWYYDVPRIGPPHRALSLSRTIQCPTDRSRCICFDIGAPRALSVASHFGLAEALECRM